ncbi:hypothetical protein [Methanosarcina sp. KYL-1]|nr:hypothetical protein [Methanosarcina sp. KYL-1]
MGKKKKFEIQVDRIQDVEVRVLDRDYKPMGDFTLNDFMRKFVR